MSNAQLAGVQAERMESRERERENQKIVHTMLLYMVGLVALCVVRFYWHWQRASQQLRNCYVLGTT